VVKSKEIGFEDILAKVNDFGRFKDVISLVMYFFGTCGFILDT